jgi:hypothetical protein
MARIPEEEVERLKREVSLERLVSGSGVELRPHGKERYYDCQALANRYKIRET